MTFSVLLRDEETGTLAAAAATGSLCVGGWVLRGDIEAGLVASQGTAPSTFWRDDALRQMFDGASADAVVDSVTTGDPGRVHRQLTALDRSGATAGFTGADSVPFARHQCVPGLVVAGNMLAGPEVLTALASAARAPIPDPVRRLLSALRAAERAGGDRRGLLSAALLVLRPDQPPLDLRIDHADDPIGALAALVERAATPPYSSWLGEVPVLDDRHRAPRTISPAGASR